MSAADVALMILAVLGFVLLATWLAVGFAMFVLAAWGALRFARARGWVS